MSEMDDIAEKLAQKYLEFLLTVEELADNLRELYKEEGMAAVDIALRKVEAKFCDKLGNSHNAHFLNDLNIMFGMFKKELASSATKLKCPKCRKEPLFKTALPSIFKCFKCGTHYEIETCPKCPHTTFTIREVKV